MYNLNMLEYDVVIIGGGTSGCACAYNCSKLGLKTLLVEKNNYLGGLMTGGLVIPVMNSSYDDINCDYYKKLVETAKKFNAQITYKHLDKSNDGWFNPEMMKIVLIDLLTSPELNNNLELLFESDIEKVITYENKIDYIVLNSKMLSIPIRSKYYVDTTGCGKLAKLSGCKFQEDNNIKQQNSLRFILGNVNVEKFCDFIKSIDLDENITNTYRNDINTYNELHFTTASTSVDTTYWTLDKVLKLGVEDGLLQEKDRTYFQLFSVAGSSNQVAFNCPRIGNYPDNPYKNSLELIDGYRAIYRLYNFSKKYFPGFENAVITNIASITGVREEGRVKTRYLYTKDDMITPKCFNNAVLSANYPIDIHSDDNKTTLKQVVNYQLPIESLISADIDNLFVAGKIVGADFESHSALRVQKSCMSMGEGVARYIASKVVMQDD